MRSGRNAVVAVSAQLAQNKLGAVPPSQIVLDQEADNPITTDKVHK